MSRIVLANSFYLMKLNLILFIWVYLQKIDFSFQIRENKQGIKYNIENKLENGGTNAL